MPSIHLYAELLNNIRSVTLVASLETEQNEETRIELSQDGQIIHVTHEGETASLSLPARMIGGGTAAITLPPIPSRDITLRLQLEEKEPGLLMLHSNSENVLPWSASTVNNNIACGHCGSRLLKPSSVKEWKDLPREDWAEMMEFWHCHKPHEEESRESHTESRQGYAAHERLCARPGVGLVGPTHFILSAEDTMNVLPVSAPDDSLTLVCASCNNKIGFHDELAKGQVIHKWNVQLKNEEQRIQNYPLQKWISALLLSSVESLVERKLVIEKEGTKGDGYEALLLWVFAGDLTFSSSVKWESRQDPTRAMKIFWKPMLNLQSSDVFPSLERIKLEPKLFDCLQQTLQCSSDLLPASARTFSGWNIGLLERFTLADVGQSTQYDVLSVNEQVRPFRFSTVQEVPISLIPNGSSLLE